MQNTKCFIADQQKWIKYDVSACQITYWLVSQTYAMDACEINWVASLHGTGSKLTNFSSVRPYEPIMVK